MLKDVVVLGVSTAAQLEETRSAIEDGPLSTEVAARVDALWAKFEHESPSDCYHDYLINLGNSEGKIH